MDARLEGFVDLLDTVASQEEDAFVVLEDTQEDFLYLSLRARRRG